MHTTSTFPGSKRRRGYRRGPLPPNEFRAILPGMSHPVRRDDERTPAKLLAEALGLPEVERVHLAAELLASVDGPEELTDSAWLAELQRRAERIRRGGAQGRPWDEVRRDLLADLGR